MGRGASSLSRYRSRRDFSKSPEPSGVGAARIAPSERLRFVIQKHDATRLHYDLRLELGDVFKSWAITRGPSLDPAQKRLAVEVEDHPLAYGDFEGTIPEGEYGGGTVMIWDRGFWAPETDEPPARSLREGELKLAIAGHKLKGSFVLVRMRRREGDKAPNWLLIKHKDRWATPGRDTIQKKNRSVASQRTMAGIAKGHGKGPSSFMTSGTAIEPKAVWDTAAKQRSAQSTTARRRATALSGTPSLPKLTHPDRVLWPGPSPLTKRDLAQYLIAVAPWMMRHLYGRPCSLLRTPEGIEGEHFFQRHPMAGHKMGIDTVTIEGDREPYIQIPDAQSLVTMAQYSVTELHPWNSAPFAPKVPGRLVFDLDPAPDVGFDDVVEAARKVRDALDSAGLVAFCKTTGGKGLHVVVPLNPDEAVSWDQAKLFARTIATRLAEAEPKRYVATMSKKQRKGRIFIDYLRNDLTATAVAPLSPRARPGAPVSMPLTWAQVKRGLDPKRFTVKTAPALIAKSAAWRDYDKSARPLQRAILRLVDGT